jgi:hypothetical protein
MSWISENINRILQIIRPHWDDFQNNGGYNSVKYPEEVYRICLSPDKINDKWIRESLIWKYGKWRQYVSGNNIPSTQEFAINKFIAFFDVLVALKNQENPDRCQEDLESFPQISSIFISHLLFPDFWAIVDQHIVRFLHWIHLQIENYKVENSSPWNLSKELNEFQSLIASKLGTTKREIDKFMMTFGKRLKQNIDISNFKNKKRSIVNKLHFKEIDWIIYFPSKGNEGRPLKNYGVAYRDRINKKTQLGYRINLGDVLVGPLIKNIYPYTIGLFQDSSGRGPSWTPAYIETQVIRSKEELLDWIRQIEEE